MSVKESCPYCGKMTPMKDGKSIKCAHCKKDLSKIDVPEPENPILTEEDHKAKEPIPVKL